MANKNVLLIGRNPNVLTQLATALTSEGYTVQTTNRVEQASQEFTAVDFDGIAFGRGVDEQTNAQLRADFSSQNEQVIFIDGLAPLIPLLIKQIKLALSTKADYPKVLTHFSYEQSDRLILHSTVTSDCWLTITLYQLDALHTTQTDTLVSQFVIEGTHEFRPILPLRNDTIRFLVAEADDQDLAVLPLDLA